MCDELSAEIQAILMPFLKKLDVVLFELNVNQQHKTYHIQVLVDKSGGGIMIDACTEINRYLADQIDHGQIGGCPRMKFLKNRGLKTKGLQQENHAKIPLSDSRLVEQYTLEVASPGLDRPLTTEIDFLRVVGRQVRFYLHEVVADKKEHTGIVSEVKKDKVGVTINSGLIAISFANISKAVQII